MSASDSESPSAIEAVLLADRLAWSMVARTHPWDCIARLRELVHPPVTAQAADNGNAASTEMLRTALARVDAALHAQGHHTRPHYAALLSMQKARCPEGPVPAPETEPRGRCSCGYHTSPGSPTCSSQTCLP